MALDTGKVGLTLSKTIVLSKAVYSPSDLIQYRGGKACTKLRGNFVNMAPLDEWHDLVVYEVMPLV